MVGLAIEQNMKDSPGVSSTQDAKNNGLTTRNLVKKNPPAQIESYTNKKMIFIYFSYSTRKFSLLVSFQNCSQLLTADFFNHNHL